MNERIKDAWQNAYDAALEGGCSITEAERLATRATEIYAEVLLDRAEFAMECRRERGEG